MKLLSLTLVTLVALGLSASSGGCCCCALPGFDVEPPGGPTMLIDDAVVEPGEMIDADSAMVPDTTTAPVVDTPVVPLTPDTTTDSSADATATPE